MNADDRLQAIWRSKKTVTAPSSKELIASAGKVRNKMRLKLLFCCIALLVTIGFISWIFHKQPPKMITTWIGFGLLFLGIITYLVSSTVLLKLLYQPTNTDTPVKEYLLHMIQVRERQRFMQKNIFTFYFITLFLGASFYMVEFMMKTSLKVAIVGSLAFGIWMAFTWFFIRKTTIAKQEKEMTTIIEKMQAIIKETETI
ncbi:MAG: hypothetical protein JO154_24995 [Chitinophaga sp.]|uniref:hypothetical protein n=1 Tax=Chitinophaga sp. TaxID=1869181 RepID=UPI0025C2DEF6|nr:hypothetical protein [Chitinophaga sp.]MBV8255876.1 hypothetical protein [Chitinophaga sp.]